MSNDEDFEMSARNYRRTVDYQNVINAVRRLRGDKQARDAEEHFRQVGSRAELRDGYEIELMAADELRESADFEAFAASCYEADDEATARPGRTLWERCKSLLPRGLRR